MKKPLKKPLKEHYSLLDALALAKLIIVERNSLPILSCVLLEPGKLKVTNLEDALVIDVPEITVGPLCIEAKKLHSLLKNIKGPLQLTATKNGGLVVNGSFTFPGYDYKEYPAVMPQGTIKTPYCGILPDRWPDVLKAASLDNTTRPQLCGICLDFGAGRIVASNGHRMHIVSGLTKVDPSKRVVIPYAAAKFLAMLMRQVQPIRFELQSHAPKKDVGAKPEFACFRVPGLEFWARPVDAEFPSYYADVIPKKSELTLLSLPRAALTDAFKMCLPFTAPHTRMVTLERTSQGLRVRYQIPDGEKIELTVPAEGGPIGKTLEVIGVHALYALDALNCLKGDMVTWGIKDETSAMLINEGEFQATLMPMRAI